MSMISLIISHLIYYFVTDYISNVVATFPDYLNQKIAGGRIRLQLYQ